VSSAIGQLRHAADGTDIACVQNLFNLADRTRARLAGGCSGR